MLTISLRIAFGTELGDEAEDCTNPVDYFLLWGQGSQWNYNDDETDLGRPFWIRYLFWR